MDLGGPQAVKVLSPEILFLTERAEVIFNTVTDTRDRALLARTRHCLTEPRRSTQCSGNCRGNDAGRGSAMRKRKAGPRRSGGTSRYVEIDPTFAAIVRAFSRDRRVSYGGQGFGSRALRLDGKIFAMLNFKGQFVVKLPRERVAELIRLGKGHYFDTGRERVMKEWLAVHADAASWLGLAKEAHRFAKVKAG